MVPARPPEAHAPATQPPLPHRTRVAVLINFLTHYRQDFYRRLLACPDIDLTIYCHQPPPHSHLKSIHEQFAPHVRLLEGRFLGDESLVWSRLPWRELWRGHDAVFIEGNPRYLSFALLATAMHWARRPVVLWTMVHSFRNVRSRQSLRLAWTRRFRRLLVYSDAEVEMLRRLGARQALVVGINNGLNQDAIDAAVAAWPAQRLDQWRAEQGLQGRRVLLSCARLESKNKFEQVLAVLPGLLQRHPDLVWCVVGDGAQREALRHQAAALGVAAQLRLVGALHDEPALAPWFLAAEALVHPGAIGLTLLHAFGYGLPVVTHGNALTHGPEFAAFAHGATGLAYREDSPEGLAAALAQVLGDDGARAAMAGTALHTARTAYNTRVMVERFRSCVPSLTPTGAAAASAASPTR